MHQDFPEDPTGKFDELKNFVRSNFEMCKWIGLLVVAAQVSNLFSFMHLLVATLLSFCYLSGLLNYKPKL